MKKLLLIFSVIVGLNTSPLMAELTQTQLNATLGIVTNFILDDNTIYHHGIEYKIVISPYTGKQWLDRNLGASQACTSFDDPLCFGYYYQWGRNADGHQESNSSSTAALATNVNNVGHGDFINSINDWASVDSNGSIRSTNWSATDGSSVCPVGFRVPTLGDMQAELMAPSSAQITDNIDAFNSFLKLPSSGLRINASINYVGMMGTVLTDSLYNSDFIFTVIFDIGNVTVNIVYPAYGVPVRCLKGPKSPALPSV